jgi:hypothetical protein
LSTPEFENELAQPGVAEASTGDRASYRNDKGFAHKPSAALYIASGIGV